MAAGDKEGARAARIKLRQLQGSYKDFSAAVDLKPQVKRTVGTVRNSAKTVTTPVKSGIVISRGDAINSPIEGKHPADIAFGTKELSGRQQVLLDKLPEYGSQTVVGKRDVSMLDLAAMTAKTGDEFALFTRKGERLIVRGNDKRISLTEKEMLRIKSEGYKWSGHTHPGITDADLLSSDGDKRALELFEQKDSIIYNAAGRKKLIRQGDKTW